MIRKLDHWIGTRLFHPPIIWLCQRTSMTQFAFYRYVWWAVALWCVYSYDFRFWSWSIVVVLFALTRTLSAAIAVDRTATTTLWFRCLIWIFVVINVPPAATGHPNAVGMNLAILVAEYAATIRTIPPRKRRERRVAAKEALA